MEKISSDNNIPRSHVPSCNIVRFCGEMSSTFPAYALDANWRNTRDEMTTKDRDNDECIGCFDATMNV
jgi:hypothetical protein